MEYKTLSANSLISAEQLNELTQDGWLLVCIVPTFNAEEYNYYFYFCRRSTAELETLIDKALALEATPE